MKVMAGMKFGMFTVGKLAANGSYGKHKRWNVTCECGKNLVMASTDIKRQNSCGCLNRFSPISTLYSHLRYRNSKYLDELIRFDEFEILSLSNCFYCDSPPANKTYGVLYSGIDRINSNFGYCPGNVRACCGICNIMKSDLDVDEFYIHIKKILLHRQGKV